MNNSDLAEIKEINEIGLELFGSEAKFALWLATSNYAIGNVKPSRLLGSTKGRKWIKLNSWGIG